MYKKQQARSQQNVGGFTVPCIAVVADKLCNVCQCHSTADVLHTMQAAAGLHPHHELCMGRTAHLLAAQQ